MGKLEIQFKNYLALHGSQGNKSSSWLAIWPSERQPLCIRQTSTTLTTPLRSSLPWPSQLATAVSGYHTSSA